MDGSVTMNKSTLRKLDQKYSIEVVTESETPSYVGITKTSTGVRIHPDEPVMLFRARDVLALPLLKQYRQLCVDEGCTEYLLKLVDENIAKFEAFKVQHAYEMKVPD